MQCSSRARALLVKCGVCLRGPSLPCYDKVRNPPSNSAHSTQLKLPLQKVLIIRTAFMFAFTKFAGSFLYICVPGQAMLGVPSTLHGPASSS